VSVEVSLNSTAWREVREKSSREVSGRREEKIRLQKTEVEIDERVVQEITRFGVMPEIRVRRVLCHISLAAF